MREAFAARPQVKCIFCEESHGGGAARNAGLAQATGKWVLFADADDFFTLCFECVVRPYFTSDADIIYFDACSLDAETYVNCRRVEHLHAMHKLYRENPAAGKLQLRYKFGEPWCKMVRRQMMVEHQIAFDEIRIHNDTRFSYLVGYYAKNVCVDPHAIYCVTDREGSVSKQISEDRKVTRVRVFATSAKFFRDHGIPIREDWHFQQMFASLRENRRTFRIECAAVRDIGYTDHQIRCGLLRVFLRRAIYGTYERTKRGVKVFLHAIKRVFLRSV